MSPLPELNLKLGLKDDNFLSSDRGEEKVITRTDSALRKHTISIVISDREAGSVLLHIGGQEVEVPTYHLTITDDKTKETATYQVTRDALNFQHKNTKRNILSYLGFKKFDKTTFLYDNIPYEPLVEKVENFDLSKHRKISHDQLVYRLNSGKSHLVLYAGNLESFKSLYIQNQYFIVVDGNDGQSFIGDILYREKFLKLTPKVELKVIRRKKIPKNFEYDDRGRIKRTIYL